MKKKQKKISKVTKAGEGIAFGFSEQRGQHRGGHYPKSRENRAALVVHENIVGDASGLEG